MTTDPATRPSSTAIQLQPASGMRRPDKRGQLPHLFQTALPDTPIGELELADILDVNWDGVQTAIEDAIVRVRHEGDLSSGTIRETLCVITLALQKLEIEAPDLRRQIQRLPSLGFWGWIFAATPTKSGQRLRQIIKSHRELKQRQHDLNDHRKAIFELRIELAGEIDQRVGQMLAAEDHEYRDLLAQLQTHQALRTTVKSILEELAKLDELEVEQVDWHEGERETEIEQITDRLPSYIQFCLRHGGTHVEERGDIKVYLVELLAPLDAQAAPLEQALSAKRQAWKQKLYADATE